MNTTAINITGTLIIISSLSATIIHCLDIWGALEYYRTHRPHKSWPAEVCIFCLGFWLSTGQLVTLSFLYGSDISYIAVALASASLTKAIYENGKFKVR